MRRPIITALRWRRRYKLRLQVSTLRCSRWRAAALLAVAPDAGLMGSQQMCHNGFTTAMRLHAERKAEQFTKPVASRLAACKTLARQDAFGARLAHSGRPVRSPRPAAVGGLRRDGSGRDCRWPILAKAAPSHPEPAQIAAPHRDAAAHGVRTLLAAQQNIPKRSPNCLGTRFKFDFVGKQSRAA